MFGISGAIKGEKGEEKDSWNRALAAERSVISHSPFLSSILFILFFFFFFILHILLIRLAVSYMTIAMMMFYYTFIIQCLPSRHMRSSSKNYVIKKLFHMFGISSCRFHCVVFCTSNNQRRAEHGMSVIGAREKNEETEDMEHRESCYLYILI